MMLFGKLDDMRFAGAYNPVLVLMLTGDVFAAASDDVELTGDSRVFGEQHASS